MSNKTETARLFKTAVLSALLAAFVKTPFFVLYLLISAETLLWAGEIYRIATLTLSTIAIVGAAGGISEERALSMCRILFRIMYMRLT